MHEAIVTKKIIEKEDLMLNVTLLEACLVNGSMEHHSEDWLDECITSQSSLIRKLAVQLTIKMGFEIPRKCIFNDPCASVRAIALERCRDLVVLKEHIRDRNSNVKIAVLGSLSQITLGKTMQDILLPDLLPLMDDQDPRVRVQFCKILRMFSEADTSILFRMFDKEQEGTFIHGAEDESLEVRLALVSALEVLVCEGIATVTFNFLCDMLNDDSADMRLKAMRLLSVISRRFKIQKDTKELFWILLCLREKDEKLNKYLLRTITNLSFTDLSVVSSLFKYLEDKTVMKTVKKLVKRNKELFLEGLRERMFLFSDVEQRQSYTIEYLVDLVILELNIEPDMTIKSYIKRNKDKCEKNVEMIEKNMRDARRMMKSGKRVFQDEIVSIVKVLDRYDSLSEYYGGIKEPLKRIRTVTSVGKFIKESLLGSFLPDEGQVEKKSFPSDEELVKIRAHLESIRYRFRLDTRHLRQLSKGCDLNLKSILKYARLFGKGVLKSPGQIGMKNYNFSAYCKSNLKTFALPREVLVEIETEEEDKDVKFILQSREDYLFFEIEKRQLITVDCIESFQCYIGVVIKGTVVKLTNEQVISGL
ncbi:Integrator complex subunit 4 [Glugoides intestinalis]